MRNIFYLCLTVLLFVSCNGQKLTFETISTKKKVLLFPDKKDTIPYATLDFKFVYPKTFDGNKEHLKALQQIFIEQFFDKDYVDYSPKETVKIYIDNYSKSYRKENAEFYDETRAYTCNHMLTIKDSIVFQNKSVLSVLQFFNSYTGGAHGVYSTSLKSINLKTLKELTLKEIIKQDKQHKFTNVLRNKLLKAMEERNGDKSYFSDFDKIQPNDNFFITDKGIKFIYNIYEIAPYIFGDFEVEILYEEISDLLKDDFKQRYNISSTEPKVAKKETAAKELDTSVVKKYIDYAEGKSLDAVSDCPYFTENFKKAYKEFMQPYENELNGINLDFDPLLCCCGTDGLLVKTIKGNYVLYEGKKDKNLYLNARLVVEDNKTLIDGLGMINMPMIKGSLKDKLWREVQACNSNFTEMDAEDMRNVIDDTQNGYLKIWGEYPTCGCACSTTVGAYKDHYGFYTLLKKSEGTCDYSTDIRSNRLLSEVLPDGFGIQTFISEVNKLPKTNFAIFTLDVAIPRKGTDTKVSLKTLPLGLFYSSENPLVYYSFERDSEMLEILYKLANDKKYSKLLEKLEHTKVVHLSSDEQAIITAMKKNISSEQVVSNEEFQNRIDKIKRIYTYYTQIKYDSLLLGWDKEKARFFIKEKYRRKEKMSFSEFLQKSLYWVPNC